MPQQQDNKAPAKQTQKATSQPSPATAENAANGKAGKGSAKGRLNGSASITNIAELQAVLEGDGGAPGAMTGEAPGKGGGKKNSRKGHAEAVAAPAQNSAGEEGGKKARKGKKDKVIRDSFTMPRNDYDKIAELKKKIQHLGLSAKKSEVLRAGLHALEQLSDGQLQQMIEGVEKIKTGRPG